MEQDQNHKEQIEKIMGQMKCPNDYQRYKLGFKKLCKTADYTEFKNVLTL